MCAHKHPPPIRTDNLVHSVVVGEGDSSTLSEQLLQELLPGMSSLLRAVERLGQLESRPSSVHPLNGVAVWKLDPDIFIDWSVNKRVLDVPVFARELAA